VGDSLRVGERVGTGLEENALDIETRDVEVCAHCIKLNRTSASFTRVFMRGLEAQIQCRYLQLNQQLLKSGS
jgi:hypothetical protein